MKKLMLITFLNLFFINLTHSRNWTCEYVVNDIKGIKGEDRDNKNAIRKMQVACVIHQCSVIQSQIQNAIEDLKRLSEEERKNFLEFLGKSPEESERINERLSGRSSDRDSENDSSNQGCQNTTVVTTLVMKCSLTPAICKRN